MRPTTATALEPSTVLRIPRPLFIKMLDSFPEAARKLREILASRLDQSAREFHNVRAALDAHEPKAAPPHPEERACQRRSANSNSTCARLEGWGRPGLRPQRETHRSGLSMW